MIGIIQGKQIKECCLLAIKTKLNLGNKTLPLLSCTHSADMLSLSLLLTRFSDFSDPLHVFISKKQFMATQSMVFRNQKALLLELRVSYFY